MKLMLRYLRPFYGRMLLGLIIKTAGSLIELALPYILSHILKNVVASQRVAQVLAWGGLMIACALAACLCNIRANRMAGKVARDFSERLRGDLFHKVQSLSAAQIDSFTVPSLESRITTDTYHVHSFVNMMQRIGVRAPILLMGGVIITLVMDRYLALTMIAMLPLLFAVVLLISRKGVPLYARVQRSVDRMVRVVREDAQGIRVIKALSKNEYEHRRFDAVNRALVHDEKRAGVTMGLANPVLTFFMNAGIVAVVAISAGRVHRGLSSPETVIAFMQYFTLISTAMMTVTRMFMMYTKASASAARIEDVLNTGRDLPVQELPPVETAAQIKFDRVDFSYEGAGDDLSEISFEVPPGGSLGIIGATGSGKSTLIKLLMRFYDADRGAIYINGKDVRSYAPEALHALFGCALQNDFIVNASVEENIRFWRAITPERVRRAARIAQADEFITAFPDEYAHELAAKGANISGGQRQRVLIARALAAEPAILVLDDSSSALDYKTDAALRRALREQAHGSTIITVAQRVSSVKDCGLILVLDQGRIIGMGDHATLMSTCSAYREISYSQMGGALVE